jgi:uncharacterized membrane protein
MKNKILLLISFLILIPIVESAIQDVDVKIIPKWLPFAMSLGRPELEVEPGEVLRTQAYVRNAHNETMRDVRIWFENVSFDIEINPLLIEELKPNEIRNFDVKFLIPENMEEGDYTITMMGVSRDFSEPISSQINLKVRKVEEQIYYLAILVLVLIVSIFIWRRIKLSVKKKS